MATAGSAGWHRDPSGRHELRYFDGLRWTEHVASAGRTGVDPVPALPFPAAGAPPVNTTLRIRDGGSLTVAIGAGVVILAAFMPWAEVWFVSATGIDGGDGWITLALATVGLILAITTLAGRTQPIAHVATLLVALAAGGVGIIDLLDVINTEVAEVGIGLWLTVAGATAMFVGAAVSLGRRGT